MWHSFQCGVQVNLPLQRYPRRVFVQVWRVFLELQKVVHSFHFDCVAMEDFLFLSQLEWCQILGCKTYSSWSHSVGKRVGDRLQILAWKRIVWFLFHLKSSIMRWIQMLLNFMFPLKCIELLSWHHKKFQHIIQKKWVLYGRICWLLHTIFVNCKPNLTQRIRY